GVMPPVVERSGDHHGGAAPCGQEGSEGSTQTPHPYGRFASRGVRRESRVQNQVAAGNGREQSAKLYGQVLRSPEGVAADGHVPGDVPVESEDDRSNGGRSNQQRPGNRCSRGLRLGRGPQRNGSALGHESSQL